MSYVIVYKYKKWFTQLPPPPAPLPKKRHVALVLLQLLKLLL